MLTQLREMFAYNRWANQRLLDACAPLSPDDLTKELGGSFPSVWSTLSHIYAAENSWLGRWHGTPAGRPSDLGDTSGIAGLRDKWNAQWAAQAAFLDTLDDNRLRETIRIEFRSGTKFEQQLGATMRHCMNHSTYHRGQVTNFLRMLGATPAGTDLVNFYREYPPA